MRTQTAKSAVRSIRKELKRLIRQLPHLTRNHTSAPASSRTAAALGAMLGISSIMFASPISFCAEINVTGDSAENVALTENSTFTTADGVSGTYSGIISGTASLTKAGTGTLGLTGDNSYSGGTFINAGTLTVYANAGTQTSADFTPLGSGTVTIADGAKLVWGLNSSNSNANAPSISNTVTGAGTLRMERYSSHGNTDYGLLSKLSDFTGTLELARKTRLNLSSEILANAQFNKISTISVENGAEFWLQSSNQQTFASDFILSGFGEGAGGDASQRGAFRIQSNALFTGTISLAEDALLGLGTACTPVFQNDFILNGHTLYAANTVNQGGTLTISGDVSQGTLVNRGFMYATSDGGTSTLALTFATSTDSNYAKDQTISAAIQQKNTNTAMVFAPADGYTITAEGVISGDGAIVKDGAGTLILAALNTFNGGITINDGIVRLKNENTYTNASGSIKYSFGSGAITINENGTLIWHNQFNTNTTLSNKILGSGKLVLEADHLKSNNQNNYISDISEFTGTLELTKHARFNGKTIGQTSNVIVNDGTTFWGSGGTFAADFTLFGTGSGAGGDTARGAIVGSGTNTYSGTISAGADTYIGLRDGGTFNLNGLIETNGHQVRFSQNHNSGGGYNFYGNVQSTGDSLGTLYFDHKTEGNRYAVKFGSTEAADSAVTQTIAANIDYRNSSSPLIFQPGANRTIEITGELRGDQGFQKTGAGTLTILNSAPTSGAVTVSGGTLTLGTDESASNKSVVGNTSRITALTVTNGAVVNLNSANTSLQNLNIVSGTVNANYQFRYVNGHPYQNVSTLSQSSITVGSEAGDAAVLKLTFKGLGDYNGSTTIYDGGELIINGEDITIGYHKGITFIGGGKVTGQSGFFNFRGNGNQSLRVVGENAHPTISANIVLYDAGFGSVNVEEANSSLAISGQVRLGMSQNDIGFRKLGSGTLYLENDSNTFRRLQIEEGTVHFRENGNLVPLPAGSTTYGVNVSIAAGAKLVLDNACNFTSAHTPSASNPSTFTMADGAALIVNYDGWQLTDSIEAALTQGTLGGSGRIVGSIDTAGLTISPGDGSIAAFTIDGDLNLANGTINLEISGAGSDSLAVTGDANLADSSIFVSYTNSSETIKFGDTFMLMSGNGLNEAILKSISFANGFQFGYEDGRMSAYLENGSIYAIAGDSASLPEPGTFVLLVLGGLGLAFCRKTRKNAPYAQKV